MRVGGAAHDAGNIVIEADRWADARRVAIIHFGCEPFELTFEPTTDPIDIEISWVGSPPNQELHFRTRSGDEPITWSALLPIGDYVTHSATNGEAR